MYWYFRPVYESTDWATYRALSLTLEVPDPTDLPVLHLTSNFSALESGSDSVLAINDTTLTQLSNNITQVRWISQKL